MSKKINIQEIKDLENRIASATTTVTDVDLMQRIIEQITYECTGGNYALS